MEDEIRNWGRHFPDLAAARDGAVGAMMDAARLAVLPEKSRVFLTGSSCRNYLLVARGVVGVHMLTESGREFLLYQVTSGQSCVLTTSCLLGHSTYPAQGVVEAEVTAYVIPAEVFQSTLDGSRPFRDFVFRDFARRLAGVIARMEEVATVDIDSRLARNLLSAHGELLVQTHQELAIELGSAREVVSRHLKRMEKLGWVALKRGAIRLTGRAAMESFLNSRER